MKSAVLRERVDQVELVVLIAVLIALTGVTDQSIGLVIPIDQVE